MAKEIRQPMVTKLNLDLEDLRPKYDRILPEIFRALEHVNESNVRGQLECLLSDVYDTFLQPEVERQESKQPSQFLEIIKRFIQEPPSIKKRNILDAIKLKGIHLKAISKLDKAKAIQKQVEDLDEYFDGLLTGLPETRPVRSVPKAYNSQRSRSYPGEPPRTVAGSKLSKNSALAALNKTQHCANSLENCPDSEIASSGRSDMLVLPREVLARSEIASPKNHQIENRDVDRTMLGRGQILHSKFSLGMGNRGDDHSGHRRRISARRRARSKRSFAQETDKMKCMAEDISEFQLNLPPRQMRDSISFVEESKTGQGEDPNPCRRAVHSVSDQSTIDATPNLLDRCSFFSFCSNVAAKTNMCGRAQKKPAVAREVLSNLLQNEESSGMSQVKRRASSVGQSCNKGVVSKLVEGVEVIGSSLSDRKKKICAMKKSNAILEEQIAEVESTLESFDNYLNTVKSKPCPVPPATLKREMYAFQEVMIERIFSCIEILSAEMKTLRKTDQTKAAKVKDFLARYEAVKKETPEALLIVGDTKEVNASPAPCASTKSATAELMQCLQAVVTGIEYFHSSCEDIWDETISRIFSELETIVTSLPIPPTKRWTPDDPRASTSMSFSSLDRLEEDMGSIKMLPEDKSKYGAVVIFALRVLERVTSELGHLMLVTRIKDLQMISIDHSIGMAYMSMRQMVLPTIKKTPSRVGRVANKKKSWKINMNEKKRKAKKTSETNMKLPECACDEVKSKKRTNVNINTDKRMLKHRLYEGQEPADEATDARQANKGLMSGQLTTDNAHHMGAAADMRLPLIHLEDFGHTTQVGDTRFSSSHSSGLSPWAQPKAKGGPEIKQKGPRGVAKIHQGEGPKPPKTANLPKIPPATHQTSSKPPTVTSSKLPVANSSKPPVANSSKPPVANSSKSPVANSTKPPVVTSSKPPITNLSKSPKTKCAKAKTTFIQETVILCNEKNEPVDCMGNTIKDRENHRPIQYCRFLAPPVPPPANLIAEEDKAAEQRHTQRRLNRKPRFRLTSVDPSAQERSGAYDNCGTPDTNSN